MYIDCKLREVRQAHRLTLRQLSDLTTVSRSDLSRIERGETDPRVSTALLLADTFKCSVNDLFTLHK